MLAWVAYFHPRLYQQEGFLATLTRGTGDDAYNALLLTVAFVSSAANMLVVGPRTRALMKQRHKLEREEAKESKTDGKAVSPRMRAMNRNFAILHSVSSVIVGVVLLFRVNLADLLSESGHHGLHARASSVFGHARCIIAAL